MPLTPAEVEQTTFANALRGYDTNEVDDFLDRVVVTMRSLEERLAETSSVSGEPQETEPNEGSDESVVGRVLVAAQKTADNILEEARMEADIFERERDSLRTQTEAEMKQLSERVASVRVELALLATEVVVSLDEMDSVIGAADTGSDGDAQDSEIVDVAGEESDWQDAKSESGADTAEASEDHNLAMSTTPSNHAV